MIACRDGDASSRPPGRRDGLPVGTRALPTNRRYANQGFVVVAGGVVFVYGSGEDTYQQRPDRAWNEPPAKPLPDMPGVSAQSIQRIAGSTHATIYALDAQTGKELWSSGNQITSWSHFSGISAANGRVYLPTYDGYVYCFGVERRK